LIPSTSEVIALEFSPIFGLATTTKPWLARYSHRSAFSHDIEVKLGA
jgi:hypothetical protein